MAGDWIKMRRGLRHDPKVIAMTRELVGRRDFINWWSDPVQIKCNEYVTECVTFANVTRVTVCALLDVWAALNTTIGEDGKAPFMRLQDLDDIAELPGFGDAMESVGWVIVKESGGLMFPNFIEHNTPSKSRNIGSKTGAERAREFRARKKAEKEGKTTVTASRNVTVDKRREEKILDTPLIPQGGDEGNKKKVLPVGAERWSPKKQRSTRVTINNSMMIRIGGFLNRQPETLWTVEEALVLSRLKPTESEVKTIEEYYLAILPEDKDYRRHNLITLLNNWNGEHDKASLWKNSK